MGPSRTPTAWHVAAIDDLDTLGFAGMTWMAIGGLSYSLGVIPFLWERLPYNHAVWHLFVMGGSACHYIAIMRYVVLG